MFRHLSKCEFTVINNTQKNNFNSQILHFCFKLHVKNIHGNHFAGFCSIFKVTNPKRHKGVQNLKLKNSTFSKQLLSSQTHFFFLLIFQTLPFSSYYLNSPCQVSVSLQFTSRPSKTSSLKCIQCWYEEKYNKVETNVFGDSSENVNMKPPMSHMYHIHIQLA
jgi:hypothetical protein